MAQAADAKEQEEVIIFQLGTNNWQVKDEPTSGSGILHEAHHNTYNALPNTHCYSIWPSGDSVQSTESFQALFKDDNKLKNKTRIFGLDGKIPVCESNHPGSSRRWHSMTPEQRFKYYDECRQMTYDFLIDIETKYHKNKKISLIIAHHTFLNPIIIQAVLEERKKNNLHIPPVAVFIHGTGIKMYQHEIREERDNVDEKEREFLLKTTPIAGVSNKDKNYKSFLEWIDKDLKLFNCDSELKPSLGYAISHKSLDAFAKVFPNFPKERLIMSPNGIDTSVVFKQDLKIADVLKDLKTFPAFKDEKSVQVPLKAPSGEDWSHLIVHVSKMADWKRPDSVLYGFADLVKEYPNALCLMIGQGTPEMNERYQGLNKELKLNDRCFFVGQKMLNELAKFYSAATVGVFPSKDEPFGMVFIECMICGTPVIGANSGGPKDFMINDAKNAGMCTTGVLVEEDKDNKALGHTIGKYLIECIKNDWKTTMYDACMEFKEKFTVKTQCENLLKETWQILNKKQ